MAEEAARRWSFFGDRVVRAFDVGVAGIHRLLNRSEEVTDAAVIISVAGMEGALTSVIGGLAACPVIGVPTSVGYGASFGGLAALLAMLNSCAAGVSVVNIDNGFGAARGSASHSDGRANQRKQHMKFALLRLCRRRQRGHDPRRPCSLRDCDEAALRSGLAGLRLPGFDLRVAQVQKSGIGATHIDVLVDDEVPERHLGDLVRGGRGG